MSPNTSWIDVVCAPLGEGFQLARVAGVEAMSSLGLWNVWILAETDSLDLCEGAAATVRLHDPLDDFTRVVPLIVTSMTYCGEHAAAWRYRLELAPEEWKLTHRGGYRVFLEKTTQDIVNDVLTKAGFASSRRVWRLSGKYMPREQCVQYGETDWAFIERLLADEGIAYFFDTDANGGPTLVLADAAGSHDGLQGGADIPLRDREGMFSIRSFDQLEVTDELTMTAAAVREYDPRKPGVPLDGQAGTGPREYFEFPTCVRDKASAAIRAAVRLEQLQRHSRQAFGRSDSMRLQPGRIVKILGASDDDLDGTYLVARVHHDHVPSDFANDRGVESGIAYRAIVQMVPGTGTLRPPIPTHRPRVEGIEPAITTGQAGEEIHVDDLGRLKIRFPWDRSGIVDDTSSAWVRSIQPAMGGAMLLPRVGWEVPVAYIHGNPDYPIVLGRAYNAKSVVPYPLPAGKKTTTLQSATSPGGGSTNELRMGDSAGGMEMFLHSSKDHSVFVGGSATTHVAVDLVHDIGLSLTTEIAGSQTLSVGASQSVNVTTDYSTNVAGGRSEAIGGLEMSKVTANRTVDTGPYTELVGGIYGLQCNQSNTNITAAMLQLIGGSQALGAGLGQSESVAGARALEVGGSRNITAFKSYSENITGVKKVTAGASTAKAGSDVLTASKSASGTVNVGGSANMTSGGNFIVASKEVTLDVSGSLTAGSLQLAGGTLKITGGTTKVTGTVKREGGTKIE